MGRSKTAVRATYEAIASSYAAARTRPWPEVLEFATGIPAGSSVLDVGCGHGRHARPLARAGHRVVGLDFSTRLLVIGRGGVESAVAADPMWIGGDATALPFRDSSFDAGLCVAVLHHLPTWDDRLLALRELRRVVRRGGRVFVSAWARDDPYLRDVLDPSSEDADVEIPWHLPDGSTVPRFYHLFRDDELERLIIECGLHGERFFRGSGNYFALASKDG